MREVPIDKAEKLAKELNILFIETSAKCGYNIKQLFKRIGDALPDLDPDLNNEESLHEIYLEKKVQKKENEEKNYCLC